MTNLTPKQKEIVVQAKNLFYENGFVETSVRDLAQKLDIKAASLYSHFNSKEEILQHICDEIYDDMLVIMHKINNFGFSADEKFSEYIKVHITSNLKKPKENDIYYKYWLLVDERVQRKYSQINYEYFSVVDTLVKNAFPGQVSLPCYIPNATTLFMLDSMTNVTKMINPENPDIDKVVKDFHYRVAYGYGKGLKNKKNDADK